jgi:hypothetical protein
LFRSKLKIFITVAASIFLFLLLTFCGLFIYVFPEHPINVAIFKFTYKITPAKTSFLEFYSPKRRDVANSKIPNEVDKFLCHRIENAADEEFSAIVNFYIIQAAGREGFCIYSTSEQTRVKIIDQIVKQLENDLRLYNKMILLEEIRLGKSLGKGDISIEGMNKPNFITLEEDEIWGKEYEKWFDEQLKTNGKTKIQEWWDSNLSWEEKKKINPLEGTNIKVSECCG